MDEDLKQEVWVLDGDTIVVTQSDGKMWQLTIGDYMGNHKEKECKMEPLGRFLLSD